MLASPTWKKEIVVTLMEIFSPCLSLVSILFFLSRCGIQSASSFLSRHPHFPWRFILLPPPIAEITYKGVTFASICENIISLLPFACRQKPSAVAPLHRRRGVSRRIATANGQTSLQPRWVELDASRSNRPRTHRPSNAMDME